MSCMQTRAELYALSAPFGLVFSGAMTAFILCAREYSPPVGVANLLVLGLLQFVTVHRPRRAAAHAAAL